MYLWIVYLVANLNLHNLQIDMNQIKRSIRKASPYMFKKKQLVFLQSGNLSGNLLDHELIIMCKFNVFSVNEIWHMPKRTY